MDECDVLALIKEKKTVFKRYMETKVTIRIIQKSETGQKAKLERPKGSLSGR